MVNHVSHKKSPSSIITHIVEMLMAASIKTWPGSQVTIEWWCL